jgi:RHS repeat-associated protein
MAEEKKTDVAAEGRRAYAPPSISLPKGGGAIRGIGEKFAANPVTGTGSMSIPIAVSPGRSGFGPQLALTYDSGAGNGPFGFGWSLSIPAISRKTDRGLPRYEDANDSDVFILSGAEDLVPVLEPDGTLFEDKNTVPGFTILRYRPRIEGLFARIERWTNQTTGETYWRSISRENVTTFYGKDNNSRIFDPADESRVFSWLICQSYDVKGNAIVYEYVSEDDRNVDFTQLSESHRVSSANRYLKRIKYGNRQSWLIAPNLAAVQWLFQVVFDYDERHYEDLPLDDSLPEAAQHRFVRAAAAEGRVWPSRPDPFSTYRSTFEVRTHRRCRRVLMFHRFDELGPEPYLVRSTEFDYADLSLPLPDAEQERTHHGSTRFGSFIVSVTQSGFVRDDKAPQVVENGVTYITYLKKSLPPVEFEYSKATIQEDIRQLDLESAENLPVGLDGAAYQWVDLDGEGISGVLTEQAEAWFYKRNLGDGEFAPVERVAIRPSIDLSAGAQLVDLVGDGQLDLVAFYPPTPGFFERTQDESWEPFQPFAQLPNIPWREPNLRFVDLDGDGHSDVLITEDEVFTWYPSLAKEGFASARQTRPAIDEEHGPRLVIADGTQSIYLADMSGDGLADLVRIRNGEVSYWPNLGYGRFGAKITMDNAPWFDTAELFDQRRVRLADIDGSGTSDIIYLSAQGPRIYFNQCGNRWADARLLTQFPAIDNISSISTVDLLGNGTVCLVWSSPSPQAATAPLRYIDLMGGAKPHLLIKFINNLGTETTVEYAPSTKFYLADKRAGKPWITRLPFPVHVVERIETFDRIGRNRFVTRSAYHHGYFDGVEREFRGFGMVEHWDTEEFAALNAGGHVPVGTNIDRSSHVPPVLARTWFHTGVYDEAEEVSQHFAAEYYGAPEKSDPNYDAVFDAFFRTLLPDTILPTGLTLEEEREACRALKGSMLRQEVYALDDTDKEKHPYTVTEQNFTIRPLQHRGINRHAVFFTHPRESVSYHFEREPADPRVGHALTLEVDKYGNVLKSAAVGYGRRQADAALTPSDQAKQNQLLISYTQNSVTKDHDTGNDVIYRDNDYRTPLRCESRKYELTGLILPVGRDRFTFDEVLNACTAAAVLEYEKDPTAGQIEKRLIDHVRTYYRLNDLTAALPLGDLQSLALPFESYRLAFTPGLLADVFGGRTSDAMLIEGGYVHIEGDANWWIPSGRMFHSPNPADSAAQELAYARQHFFLSQRYRDPFHTNAVSTEGVVTYDGYDLLVHETRDALGNQVTAGERQFVLPNGAVLPERRRNDYRVLQPALIMDPNRNCSEVRFDALGMVAGTAVMGKPEENLRPGDRLAATFRADLTLSQIEQFLADPKGPIAGVLLDNATTRVVYDLTGYRREPDPGKKPPAVAVTMARETHASEPVPVGGVRIQASFSYSDGFGREIQKKIEAEAGPVPVRDGNGNIIVGPNGQPQMTPNDVSPRWVESGWMVFNNKGKPVRQYEPLFTDTPRFEFDVKIGVSPVLFYDPIDRVVATLQADHTWEKVIFDPWREETWDVNDTILVADPGADADVGEFFGRLANADYLPTWHALRTDVAHAVAFGARYPDPTDRANETRTAEKATVHAATPTIAHADSLGRVFLTVAHNKAKYSNTPPADPPIEEFQSTRIVFDIEGNQRELTDARDRIVVRYDYDILGNRIHQASMEAGERWMLNDVAGRPLYEWDGRDHRFRFAYDPLRRPTDSFLREGANAEMVVGRTIYGESRINPEIGNLRAKVVELRDQAGVVSSAAYDFKGNLLLGQRRLAQSYKTTLDWLGAVPLHVESYISRTRYDALNRPTQLIAPHSDQPGTTVNIIQPIYNEANLLDEVHVWLSQNAEPLAELDPATANLHAVTDIDYDAKGQRAQIAYGNGVRTTYTYDALTFRLANLLTRRDAVAFPADCPEPAPAGWPGCRVQNLHYTFDPAGNITHIRDDAQQTIYFRNQRVEPSAAYIYDAVYRLIEATGREHLGQVGTPIPHSYNDAQRVGLLHPGDGNAMGRYLERYVYDAVGNFLEMRHQGTDPAHPGWTRTYTYDETSALEAGNKNNRLTSTTIGVTAETYSNLGDGYDTHGNTLRMPHLQLMRWDFSDQLQMTSRQAVNPADADGVQHEGERTWFVYDSTGRRVRKVTELPAGQVKEERIYLGGFEIYRKEGVNPLVRETLHITDDRQRIGVVETRTAGNEPGVPGRIIRYEFGNHLGSASLELDDQAQIISYEEYTPYGSTSYHAVRSQVETPKRYRYSGKERDDETGFYYHGARYYAPWIGRWTSCDPSGLTEGLNLYVALRDSPVNRHDANGMESVGALIEEKALKAAAEERYVSLYLWSFLDVTWSVFGAEGVSKVSAGTATKGDYVSAGIEIASVIPGGKLLKGAKGLFVAEKALAPVVVKEVIKEAAPVVVKEVVKEAAPVVTKEIVKDTAPVIAKKAAEEVAPVVVKEAVPAAAKDVVKDVASVAAKEIPKGEGLSAAADSALKKAAESKAPAVAASTLGKVGTASTRRGFRTAAAEILTKDKKHPLRFLLGPNGKFRPSTAKGLTGDLLIEAPEIIEAGHAASAKALTGAAKGTDRFVVMSAHYNRMILSATIEHPSKGGSMLLNYALDIGGIPVHAGTARDWVAKELLAPEVLETARLITF